ncbi:MAG TPA: hypothetical protein VIM41_02360, partial [Gammaproteobacteria bacterium]
WRLLGWISFGEGNYYKMNLRLADELTIKLIEGLPEDAVPVSEVFINGAPTGKRVSGALLAAAVQWQDKYLLLTTDDCPFEEFLGIRLFDSEFNLLDSASIGTIYNTGMFSSLALHEPNTVSFLFIGETIWRIELLLKPGFRVPFFTEPHGVWRDLSFHRHFIVHGNPQRQPRAKLK